jgi:hypothetical protein
VCIEINKLRKNSISYEINYMINLNPTYNFYGIERERDDSPNPCFCPCMFNNGASNLDRYTKIKERAIVNAIFFK